MIKATRRATQCNKKLGVVVNQGTNILEDARWVIARIDSYDISQSSTTAIAERNNAW